MFCSRATWEQQLLRPLRTHVECIHQGSSCSRIQLPPKSPLHIPVGPPCCVRTWEFKNSAKEHSLQWVAKKFLKKFHILENHYWFCKPWWGKHLHIHPWGSLERRGRDRMYLRKSGKGSKWNFVILQKYLLSKWLRCARHSSRSVVCISEQNKDLCRGRQTVNSEHNK